MTVSSKGSSARGEGEFLCEQTGAAEAQLLSERSGHSAPFASASLPHVELSRAAGKAGASLPLGPKASPAT